MTSVDDVGVWFKAHWNLNATLPAIVTAGIWNERVFEQAGVSPRAPYAVFMVDRGGVSNLSSGMTGLVDFTVSIAVYTDMNEGVDKNAVESAVDLLMKPVPSYTTLRSGVVWKVAPSSSSAKFEAFLRNTNDVLVSRSAWRVTVLTNTQLV